jgi:5,10-methylene-tetrahydrofolate dehydrogenase/methenyl tetrahydrofolate cyclohydrolase
VSEDSTLILNNDIETLVESDMVEEYLMIIGIEIESVSNGCINGDITFSSSYIEQGPFILT